MLNLLINEQKQILGGYYFKIKYFHKDGNMIAFVGHYTDKKAAERAVDLHKYDAESYIIVKKY